ncbi:MAG: MFS transporter [Henriciella sp.]|nr:MFS transporter [Henriciella sp.]
MSDVQAQHDSTPGSGTYLRKFQIYMLAIASAVVTANAYYIHPIISLVADDFEIAQGMIGIVPAFNQIALALGILVLLPLGDLMSNKRLTVVSAGLQTTCVAGMAFAPGFELFLLFSTVLGFVTIAPYLLPAYASKRVAPERLGYVTAVLTTGIIIGILVARAAAGVVAEYLGWRTVYILAAGLMLSMAILLPLTMDRSETAKGKLSLPRYLGLLGSIWPLVLKHPQLLISGTIQGLGFGSFIAVWMGLGLHLPSDEMGYGVDTVGYLALLAIVSLASTPWLGKWADSFGARRARVILACLQTAAMMLFVFVGHSLWLLIIPIVMTNMFGPSIDVTGRMTFLSQAPEVRTRLMTVYVVIMFLGGGLGSWIGTASYDWGGWQATAFAVLAMMSTALVLSVLDWLLERRQGEA